MFSIKKIKELLKKNIESGSSPDKLALSFCIGLYIAFSPFPGAHTVMMLAGKWLFKLNFPMLFIATSFNNPWTLIPFFSFDYVFGYWFTHSLLGLNPEWTISLAKIFNSGNICLWSFFIGGNILGIGAALISYPIARSFFKKISQRKQQTVSTNQ